MDSYVKDTGNLVVLASEAFCISFFFWVLEEEKVWIMEAGIKHAFWNW